MERIQIEEKIARFPLCQYAFAGTEEISFTESVRYICETECEMYGESWSCPPAVGSVEECRQRCGGYPDVFIFTTVAEIEDITDMAQTLATRQAHEEITRGVADVFREEGAEIMVLSTESCTICKKCTYPDAPCRHPDKMYPCVESFGILVTAIAEKYGISFYNGSNVVTWFSMIFYR